jgi:hypothetical protein
MDIGDFLLCTFISCSVVMTGFDFHPNLSVLCVYIQIN